MVFQWFSGDLSGKLFEVARQHCLFLQGERVSMRKRSAQVLRAEKNPHTCACHATLAAEHERSKSLCVSPPPRAALDCRILARGDCGPAKLAVGSLINCHWCAVGVLGLPLLGRRAAGFPGAGSRVSFAAARSATTSAGNRFIVRDACVFKMHSC